MYRLVAFFKRIFPLVTFILLEAVALHLYSKSTPYAQARMMLVSNRVVGVFHSGFAEVKGYFSLRRENQKLLEQITNLQSELSASKELVMAYELDSLSKLSADNRYFFTSARVVKNSTSRQHNMIIINRGRRDGVANNMALISANGAMVGYIKSSSDGYAVAMSVLNTDFNGSGKLLNSEYFGSVKWDGMSPYRVQMRELSKYAPIHVGDTVVSTGYSQYFPEGIPIGVVEEFELQESSATYNVELRLLADFFKLHDVILIQNTDALSVAAAEQMSVH